MQPLIPILLFAPALAVACVAPGADVPEESATGGLVAPTFAPLDAPSGTPAPTPTDGTVRPTPAPSTIATAPPAPDPTHDDRTTQPTPRTTTAAPTRPVTGRLTDATGDLRGVTRSQAPPYADLREASIRRTGREFVIRVSFAAPAPDQADGDEILNVATFHDVTGDGRIDHEIWASMTANGWGTAWYDNRRGTARFAADDEVEVDLDDGVLVLTFPSTHLDGASSGRWLTSTEWGTALTLSSGTGVTDDAPDDRQGRPWPS